MNAIHPVVRIVLHQQVADQIESLIVSGMYPTGTLLPPERELGKPFGVSRTVIREAIRILVTKGLVEVRQGQGARVREQNADKAAEALSLLLQMRNGSAAAVLEARGVIEPGIAGLAAERATADDIVAIRSANARLALAMEMADATTRTEAFIDADSAFHQALARASRNEVLLSLMEALRELVFLVRRISFQASSRVSHTVAAHQAIIDAIAAHDAPQAREAMRNHLNEVAIDVRQVERKLGTKILAFDPLTHGEMATKARPSLE